MYKKGEKLRYLGNNLVNDVSPLYAPYRDFNWDSSNVPVAGEICFVTVEDNKRPQVQFPSHPDRDWNAPQGRAVIYIKNLAPWIEQLLL